MISELACGHLRQRQQVLSLLGLLPALPGALDREVLQMIEEQGLMGRGIG